LLSSQYDVDLLSFQFSGGPSLLLFDLFDLNWVPWEKAIQLRITPAPKQTLPLVRPSFANRYLMNARLGFAWAVAVLI
jgi:hypothetical protein